MPSYVLFSENKEVSYDGFEAEMQHAIFLVFAVLLMVDHLLINGISSKSYIHMWFAEKLLQLPKSSSYFGGSSRVSYAGGNSHLSSILTLCNWEFVSIGLSKRPRKSKK